MLRRLFDPTEGTNDYQHRVFGLWNGTDSLAPPPYMGVTFPTALATTSPAAQRHWTLATLKRCADLVTVKGYGIQVGSQLIILANPSEAEVIQSWRAGEVIDNAQKAKYDFVPSSNAPPFLTTENVHGAIPPPDFHGLKVLGAYGKAWLIETNYVPAGWVAVVASGGPGSPQQSGRCPLHANVAYQGLRAIPGHWSGYPLIDSFFARGVGVGVRHRGAAAVLQVTSNASYTPPSATVIPI